MEASENEKKEQKTEVKQEVQNETEKADDIEEYKIYDNERPFEMMLHNDVADYARVDREVNGKILIRSVDVLERKDNILEYGEKLKLRVNYVCNENGNDFYVRCIVRTPNHTATGTTMSENAVACKKDNREQHLELQLDTSSIAPGKYVITIVFLICQSQGNK